MPLIIDEAQRIGLILSGLGLLFTTLGIMFFLDRGLLTIGNLLFLAGVSMIVGWKSAINLFFQTKSIKGSVCFFLGIILVLLGWSLFGIIAEFIGVYYLFGSFFPIALAFLKKTACNWHYIIFSWITSIY